MRASEVQYRHVQVIGQMASFAIIQFDEHVDKQKLTYGDEVKTERGIWFEENIDKDARAR